MLHTIAVVQEFLEQCHTSGVQFLSEMIAKYIRDPEHADLPMSGNVLSTSHSPQPEQSSDEPSWKQARLEMLARHAADRGNSDREIEQLRCLSSTSDDMLKWWRQQTSTFLKLAALARSVLAVPATSAPSERVFSVAGLVINAKRSSLVPLRANKIILFMKTIVLLQHLKTTKHGYSCILYPCLC